MNPNPRSNFGGYHRILENSLFHELYVDVVDWLQVIYY